MKSKGTSTVMSFLKVRSRRLCSLTLVSLWALSVFAAQAGAQGQLPAGKAGESHPENPVLTSSEAGSRAVPTFGLMTDNNNPNGNSVSLYSLQNGELNDLEDIDICNGCGHQNPPPCNPCIKVMQTPTFFCAVIVDGLSQQYPYGDIEVGKEPPYALIGQPPPFYVQQTIPAPIDPYDGIQSSTIDAQVTYGSFTYPPPGGYLVYVTYTDLSGQQWMQTYVMNFSNCTLSIYVPIYQLPIDPVEGMAPIVQPNSKQAGAVVAYQNQEVGSVVIVEGKKAVQYGPYPSQGNVADVQVTSNGKFAIFGDNTTGAPQIEVYPINTDFSLGQESVYSNLGPGSNSANIHMSPDERFLYVGNISSGQITTLSLDPVKGAVSYACISPVLNGFATNWATTEGMDTEVKTGAGGYLYVAENAGGLSPFSSIGVLAIDENTGCATEVPGSPFLNLNSPGSFSFVSVPTTGTTAGTP
jgi:hypothetical protein